MANGSAHRQGIRRGVGAASALAAAALALAGCSLGGDVDKGGNDGGAIAAEATYSVADIELPSGFGVYFHETAGYDNGVDVPEPYEPGSQSGVTEALYATPSAGIEQIRVLTYAEGALDDVLAGVTDLTEYGGGVQCGADGGDSANPVCGIALTDGAIKVAVNTDFADMDPRGVPASPDELAGVVDEFLTAATSDTQAEAPDALGNVEAAELVLPEQLGVVYAHIGDPKNTAPEGAVAFSDYGLSDIPQFTVAAFPGVTADSVKADLTDVQTIRRVECGTSPANGYAVCVVPLADGVLVVNDSPVLPVKNIDASSRFTAALLFEILTPNPA